jgi:hypothetical protein
MKPDDELLQDLAHSAQLNLKIPRQDLNIIFNPHLLNLSKRALFKAKEELTAFSRGK